MSIKSKCHIWKIYITTAVYRLIWFYFCRFLAILVNLEDDVGGDVDDDVEDDAENDEEEDDEEEDDVEDDEHNVEDDVGDDEQDIDVHAYNFQDKGSCCSEG